MLWRDIEMTHALQAPVLEALRWREPIEAITDFYPDADEILARNPDSASIKAPRSFPFFERPDFLFAVPTFDALLDRLPKVAAHVETPVRQIDNGFCLIVRSVCDYFGGGGRQILRAHARAFDLVAQHANSIELPDDPGFLRSIDRLNEVRDGWLLNDPDQERIQIYGHGAVTISQIARFAFRGGQQFIFDDEARDRWAKRQFCSFFAWRWFAGPWIAALRRRDPSKADTAYWDLRAAGVPFVSAENAAPTGGDVHGSTPIISVAEAKAFQALQKELRGIVMRRSKSSCWQAILHTDRPTGSRRFAEELADGEMPLAIAKALAEDRAKTPEDGWWEHLINEMLSGSTVPIVSRVDRDLIDAIRKSRPAEVDVSECQLTIFSARDDASFRKTDLRLTIDKIRQCVCHSDCDRAIWDGYVAGKTLHQIGKVVGLSKSRVDQVLKELFAKARAIV
jgi:hypothetical protein